MGWRGLKVNFQILIGMPAEAGLAYKNEIIEK